MTQRSLFLTVSMLLLIPTMSISSQAPGDKLSQRIFLSKALLNEMYFFTPHGSRISHQALDHYMKRHLQITDIKTNPDLSKISLDDLSRFDNESDNLTSNFNNESDNLIGYEPRTTKFDHLDTKTNIHVDEYSNRYTYSDSLKDYIQTHAHKKNLNRDVFRMHLFIRQPDLFHLAPSQQAINKQYDEDMEVIEYSRSLSP